MIYGMLLLIIRNIMKEVMELIRLTLVILL